MKSKFKSQNSQIRIENSDNGSVFLPVPYSLPKSAATGTEWKEAISGVPRDCFLSSLRTSIQSEFRIENSDNGSVFLPVPYSLPKSAATGTEWKEAISGVPRDCFLSSLRTSIQSEFIIENSHNGNVFPLFPVPCSLFPIPCSHK